MVGSLIAFFLLIMSGVSFAAAWQEARLMMFGGSTVCSMTTSDCDTLCESFEGANTGYDLADWTETVDGTGVVDQDAARPAGMTCTEGCSEAVKVVMVAGSSSKTLHTHTAKSTLYTKFVFYLDAESLGNSQEQIIYIAKGGANNAFLIIVRQEADGSLNLKFHYHNAADTGTDYATLRIITIQTLYVISVAYVSGTSIHFYVNDVEVGAGSVDVITRNIDTAQIGLASAGVSYGLTYYIDNLKLDDDTMPTACP